MFEQMGNIGSEVGRALRAKQAGRKDDMRAAFYRGIDLMNLTINDWIVSKKGNTKELLCAREQFGEAIFSEDIDSGLERYFMSFAEAARIQHLRMRMEHRS